MMELPETLSAMQQTLKQINNAQIYLVLTNQHSVYFEGIPKMESFKACYKAIYQKGNLNLASEGMQLCEYLRIKPDHLKFILRVFYDLDFIKMKKTSSRSTLIQQRRQLTQVHCTKHVNHELK